MKLRTGPLSPTPVDRATRQSITICHSTFLHLARAPFPATTLFLHIDLQEHARSHEYAIAIIRSTWCRYRTRCTRYIFIVLRSGNHEIELSHNRSFKLAEYIIGRITRRAPFLKLFTCISLFYFEPHMYMQTAIPQPTFSFRFLYLLVTAGTSIPESLSGEYESLEHATSYSTAYCRARRILHRL